MCVWYMCEVWSVWCGVWCMYVVYEVCLVYVGWNFK